MGEAFEKNLLLTDGIEPTEAVKFIAGSEVPVMNFLGLTEEYKLVDSKAAPIHYRNDVAEIFIYQPEVASLYIYTLEGKMEAKDGDYIIKGVNGEFYPCKPDIFEKTYDLADEDSESLIVDTIYSSFMGEVNKFGIGSLCTFVRLQGCNLRCYKRTCGFLCDTPEALLVKRSFPEKEKTIPCIVDTVEKLGNKIICLTGGEPLLQEGVETLLRTLSSKGYHVVVETNGSVGISKYRNIENVSFVVDYKLPSTGEDGKMDSTVWPLMQADDYLKFVVSNGDDLLNLRTWLGLYAASFKGILAIGSMWEVCCFSQEELLAHISSLSVEFPSVRFCLNTQTHKLISLYDQTPKLDLQRIKIKKDL